MRHDATQKEDHRTVAAMTLAVLATGLALLSLLAVFPAPFRVFWIPAIVFTEWGHWISLMALLSLGILPRETGLGKFAGVALGITALFSATPLVRAALLPGPSPISFPKLWLGVTLPALNPKPIVFSRVDATSLSLDLYQFPATAPQPLVVVVHGGSWQSGDSGELPTLNRYLASRGYTVAAVNYRLAPRWIYRDARLDVESAIDYLRLHARELRIDPDRVVLLGRSAGGQIALSTAYHEIHPYIRGVIAFYAPNDLLFGYENAGSTRILDSKKLIREYVGGTPGQVPAAYQDASPLTQVGPHTPPTLLIHGLRDELVWPAHSFRLMGRMKQAGRSCEFLKLPWATHGCDANFSGPSGQWTTHAVMQFLEKVIPQGDLK